MWRGAVQLLKSVLIMKNLFYIAKARNTKKETTAKNNETFNKNHQKHQVSNRTEETSHNNVIV